MAINFEALTGWNNSAQEHDSSLDESEMRALILRIPTDIADPNKGVCSSKEIKRLFAYFGDKPQHKLKLVKGIHQGAELHYTIALLDGGCFHIYVAQGETVPVRTQNYGANLDKIKNNMKKYATTSFSYNLLQYKNVGVSSFPYDNNYNEKTGVKDLWPAQFETRNNYPGRQRGNSYSVGNSAPIRAYFPNSGQVRGNTPPTLEEVRNPPRYDN